MEVFSNINGRSFEIEKNVLSLLKKASAEEKEYLKVMFAFAQGEITTDDFICDGYKTGGGPFNRINPNFQNWWQLIKLLLG